jgi:hypothetical protein
MQVPSPRFEARGHAMLGFTFLLPAAVFLASIVGARVSAHSLALDLAFWMGLGLGIFMTPGGIVFLFLARRARLRRSARLDSPARPP